MVGFYALYLAKQSPRWRAVAAIAGAACFAFVAWSWSELHELMLADDEWTAFYAAGARTFAGAGVAARFAAFGGGMAALFAAAACWQAHGPSCARGRGSRSSSRRTRWPPGPAARSRSSWPRCSARSRSRGSCARSEPCKSSGVSRFVSLALAAVAACGGSSHHGPTIQAPTGIKLATHDPVEPVADRIANQVVGDGDTAAVTIGIARKDGSVFVKAYGLADVTGKILATPSTIYRIGSLTKQFTAAAILQLAEQKKLTLDDDVLLYAKVDTGGRVVTLRELLNHTSGIPSYTDTADFPEWSRSHHTPQELVDHATKMLWEFEPGTHFHYSNTGYVLLGMVIEKVSGQSYADYLRDHVFPLAHLTNTRYCDDKRSPDRARGYASKNDLLVDADPLDLSTPFSAGALCSTVPDLLAWTAALATGKVISPASYALMTTPPTSPKSDYGMGLTVDDFEQHRQIWHNGGINGFISELHAFPDDGIAIAVLTNAEGDAAPRVERELAYAALGMPSKSVIPAPHELEEVAGSYDVPGLGPTPFSVHRHRLVVAPPKQGQLALEYTGGDTYVLNEPPVTFVFHRRPGDNLVTSVTIQQSGRSLDAPRVDAPAGATAGSGS